MAQHYPTKLFKQKKFREIENGIKYAFRKSRGYMKTSFVYEFIEKQGENEVYLTSRKIPNGIVWGDNTGCFEIHFNAEKKIINEIYLVA